MFEVVTLKSLGLEVTSMRKWLYIVENVVLIVISYEINSIYKRNVSKFYNFLMFEVVTLKSLGLEVTGMRKWLDIVDHVVPIVISYKINSIYKRNVLYSYKFLMFEVVTLKSLGLEVTSMKTSSSSSSSSSFIFKTSIFPRWARVRRLPQIKSLHISLKTAHSGCKPSSFMSSLTHCSHVFLLRPRVGRHEDVTWYCWTCSPYSHIIQN